ncbi:MAG: hypothetical protein OHK0056_08040 [Bacteriovoracaceae bacterium]
MLGDFSKRYEEKSTDPLNYVFRSLEKVEDKSVSRAEWERGLYQYRAIIEDGMNWQKSCPVDNKIEYPLPVLAENATRSYVATLQYIGLDILSRALPLYAKNFEFNKEEYTNFVDRLIGGFCSKNLTVISLKELKNNMLAKFDNRSSYHLPTIEGNPFFPQRLSSISAPKEILRREFHLSIELFKTFCSWGNETDNLRLMPPLLKHPVIMSFIARQIEGEQYEFSPVDRRVFAVRTNQTARILCDNFICRPVDQEQMRSRFPRSIGFTNFYSDMKRLYCSKLRDVDYLYRDQIPEILEIIKKRSFDEDNLLALQFISLITGVPDFLISGEKYSQLKATARASMDESWDRWAQEMNGIYKSDLLFEEGLSLELADSKKIINRFNPKFVVDLDVNLGEFDRSMSVVGKITTTIPIKVSTKFLAWARHQWGSITPEEIYRQKIIIRRMIDQLKPSIENAQKNVETKILKSDFLPIVSEEFLKQLVRYEGTPLSNLKEKELTLNINFNYAPFALKYLRQQFLNEKKEDSWKKFADSLVVLKKEGNIEVYEKEESPFEKSKTLLNSTDNETPGPQNTDSSELAPPYSEINEKFKADPPTAQIEEMTIPTQEQAETPIKNVENVFDGESTSLPSEQMPDFPQSSEDSIDRILPL